MGKQGILPTEVLYRKAWLLSIFTIAYNLVEGGISTYYGAEDETLALLGFGVDSFVEVISGVGIAHMIWRMRVHPITARDRFEKGALRTTGTAFYLLTAGLIIGSALDIFQGAKPHSTLAGIIIAVLSIAIMYYLYREKLKVGHKLNSSAIISDAKCTKTCFYLSFILLASSGIYLLLKIPYIDAMGSLAIAWYAFKEGKEAFGKAKTGSLSC